MYIEIGTRVISMALLPILALVSLASAGGEAPPVVNGDTTGDFEAVGALVACQSANQCGNFCSATLIAPDWVVSAAHCVDALDDYDRWGYDVHFVVGRSMSQVTDHQLARTWVMHPDFSQSSSNIQHDIGLVQLESAMTSVEPVPLNADEVDWNWRNEDLTYVGYGITSDDANDSGTKRYAEMPVIEYDDQFIYALDTVDDQNLCSGDSGGAALEPQSDGSFELAGVNSFVFAYSGSTSCVGGGSGATRVDTHLDWILEYVDLGSTGGGEGGEGGEGGVGTSPDGHTYEAAPYEAPVDDGEDPSGAACACASTGGPAPLGWLALVLGGLVLPRRRSVRPV